MNDFATLELCPPILDAIAAEGYDTPTPIQAKAIPPALAGRDVLGCAQTGTGKTAAFALPILHRLHTAAAGAGHGNRQTKRRGPVLPRALILSPTRELAGQIEASFRTYGRRTRLRQTVIYGGVSQFHQVRALQRGVDILVATPGRLIDLMEQGYVDLRQIQIFVLDEADRMLDMGFIQPIRRIAESVPDGRQTMLFSATMPRSIMSLADSLLTKPVNVSVKPAASTTKLINQFVYMVPHRDKPALMEHLLVEHGVDRGLIFTRTKHGADRLTRRLKHAGVTATAIHGNKTQNQRQQALDSFRSGKSRVLVATDVAARGLDVDGVTHVFNYDLPHEPEAYVHRIGRTGRAGARGVAISFCDRAERPHLRAIEQLTSKRLQATSTPASIQGSGAGDAGAGDRKTGVASPAPAAAAKKDRRASGGPSGSSKKRRFVHSKKKRGAGGSAGGAGGGGRRRQRSAR
ncbi:MAG: DEAD/DEAH box helicase [Planctomycetes bacterium]|nr:DEAD/DEAH box helicase [Planctomycetota bacterium]NOG53477.1 DEAD/DEAH box helicase [Planctomycetota bacterium]